jgi:DNA-binding NarL/FixJ family response regulator
VSNDPQLIRILAVDDHPLLREGIAALVNAEPDMKLIAEACNGEEAVAKFRLYRPEITLMDLQMPNLNGVDAIRRIIDAFPDARIIVLTTYSGDVQVLRALKAGARGYLLKGHVHRELLAIIRAVHVGQKRIPPEIAAELANYVADDELSPRQVEILRLMADGKANKQIANQLDIGEATVKSHVTNILSKLRANDRTHAVMIGLKRGIIDLQNS